MVTSFRLDQALKDKVERLSRQMKLTKSDVVRYAIWRYLEQNLPAGASSRVREHLRRMISSVEAKLEGRSSCESSPGSSIPACKRRTRRR